jgi:hypothetical protein
MNCLYIYETADYFAQEQEENIPSKGNMGDFVVPPKLITITYYEEPLKREILFQPI